MSIERLYMAREKPVFRQSLLQCVVNNNNNLFKKKLAFFLPYLEINIFDFEVQEETKRTYCVYTSVFVIILLHKRHRSTENLQSSEVKSDAMAKKQLEISTVGEDMVTMALRTLRLKKSSPFSQTNSETVVLNEEKCRRIYSLSEVADHDSYNDCWIVLYDRVYDVTNFLNQVTTF